jgi:peptidoglycan/LPS O-acetylase OafA/YrhL
MEVHKHSNRYLELDALRGIAALLVVFFHFTRHRPEADFGFKLFATGVDLFFMISGFVIFMSFAKITKGIEFVINRFCRLYPTYWASVSFSFLIICLTILFRGLLPEGSDLLRYLGNLTMFQYYMPVKNLEGAYWTMIIEMLFYILMFLLYKLRLFKWINLIGVCLSIVSLTLVFGFGTSEFAKLVLAYFPLLKFIPLFFAGIVFYKLIADERSGNYFYLLILFYFLCQLALFESTGRSNFGITQYQYILMLLIYFGVFVLFVNQKLSSIVSKLTLFLGKISFALYLIHEHLSHDVLLPLLVDKWQINFWLASVFIVLPAVISVATIITYGVEIPIGKSLKIKLRKLAGIADK